MMTADTLKEAIESQLPNAVEETSEVSGMPALRVRAEILADICSVLKESSELRFDYLMSLSAVDWSDRLEVVYHLYSIYKKHYATLKVNTDKKYPVLPSVTSVWKAADWQEREVYDMFGIDFDGHPDLRRILLEPDWEGFPLRKDYQEASIQE